jgi:hypothetical protein
VYPFQIDDLSRDYDKLLTRSFQNLMLRTGWKFHSDSIFSLWADGRYHIAGFQSGDFQLQGGIGTAMKGNVLTVEAEFGYRKPDYFFHYYNSNHFRWNRDLEQMRDLRLTAGLYLPDLKTRLVFKPSVIHNYTYLDAGSVPVQYRDNLEIITVVLEKQFQFWKFYSNNKGIYQYSDQSQILGIPRYYLQHRFVFRHKFHFNSTGGNLYTQLGWSIFYYPAYFTDSYMPALGLFHRQQDEKIGGDPLFNLFANIRIKRVNIFGKLYHLNSYIQERNFYSAPLYPMSPMMIKIGVSWLFYD